MQVRHKTAGQRLVARCQRVTRQERSRHLPDPTFTVVLVLTGAVVSVAAGILAGLPISEWPPVASRPTQGLVMVIVAVAYGFLVSRSITRRKIAQESRRQN